MDKACALSCRPTTTTMNVFADGLSEDKKAQLSQMELQPLLSKVDEELKELKDSPCSVHVMHQRCVDYARIVDNTLYRSLNFKRWEDMWTGIGCELHELSIELRGFYKAKSAKDKAGYVYQFIEDYRCAIADLQQTLAK